MNKNVIVFSIAVVCIITFFLIFSIFWILLFSWGDVNSAKDSLSIVSGIFGGVTTLSAAVIAAYLFNDWKDQKKYEIVSSLAIEAHREFIYAKDKYMFFLFQHIYETPEITYKEVDDDLFKVISKLNLLDAILERFQFGIRIDSEINSIYTDGYCEVPKYYRDVNDLKNYGENQLRLVFDKAFKKDQELFKKLLDIIEKVEIKK